MATLEKTHSDRILAPIAECLTYDVAKRLVNLRAAPDLQARLNVLADKANKGTLTQDESDEYREYIDAIDYLTILQAQARTVIERGC